MNKPPNEIWLIRVKDDDLVGEFSWSKDQFPSDEVEPEDTFKYISKTRIQGMFNEIRHLKGMLQYERSKNDDLKKENDYLVNRLLNEDD